MIFDTHAHYDDEAFDEDREQLLAGFKENGIGAVTNVAASLSSCKTTLELARKHDFMYAALGVHPSESAELSDTGLKQIEAWCTEKMMEKSAPLVRSAWIIIGKSRIKRSRKNGLWPS